MKTLSIVELASAPHIIQAVYRWTLTGMPIGSDLINEAMLKHPEYFEEEISRARRWKKIPEVVHVCYGCELSAHRLGMFSNDAPESKGVIHYAQHPEDYAEYKKEYSKWYDKAEKTRELIWNKYYAEYGFHYKKDRT